MRAARHLRSHLGLGLAVAAVYLVAVLGTLALRPSSPRPLYDGFVPPSSYQWVKPPAFFAPNNVRPKPVSTTIALTPRGSVAAGVATPDGQFVIDLAAGAIAPATGAMNVAMQVTPLAPSSLTPLPSGLRGNGNAYRVEMHYEPGGEPVAGLARPGSLLVEIPELGRQLFRSTDHATWITVSARPIGPRGLTLVTDFDGPGDYVAATNLPELVTATRGSSHGALVVGLIVGALAVVLIVLAFFVTRATRSRRAAAR